MRLLVIATTVAILSTSPNFAPVSGQSEQRISSAEYRARRERAMQLVPDSILLVRARPSAMEMNQERFRQDPAFYYLTGLGNAVGALLALDARRRESWLFVPEQGRLGGFASQMTPPHAYVGTGVESAKELALEHVEPWSEFAAFLDRRLAEDPTLVLRGPFQRDATAPAAALVGQDGAALWEAALRARWPRAQFGRSPAPATLRSIKAPDEITILRRVAQTSAAALKRALGAIRPGRRQREAEAAVFAACAETGADGISFWPWVMSGPNSDISVALRSLVDERFLDREMRSGELVRLDMGCASQHYEGDVGRTVPVSGRFDAGQREAWEAFIAAYRGALEAMRPEQQVRDVFATWRAEFARRRSSLQTPFGRRTAEVALGAEAEKFWQLHHVGVAHAEDLVDTIRVGHVFAFEPVLTVDGVGLYLEDMILMTPQGAEVLTTGLPYTADEIERAMQSTRR